MVPNALSVSEADPEHTRVHETFDNDCPWPRRLLHIPTLTSYPWRPGNVYGGQTEPLYHAITYTWGRWRIRDDALHPSVRPLDFGTPWEVPRVDPARFTAEQFVGMIKSLATAVPIGPRGVYGHQNVEFVWLDVACIDQRNDSREKELEVGRQAAIFKGAHRVCAWLHEYENAKVDELFEQLDSGYAVLLDAGAYVAKLPHEIKEYGSAQILKEVDADESGLAERRLSVAADYGRFLSELDSLRKKKLESQRDLDPQETHMQHLAHDAMRMLQNSRLGKKPPKRPDVRPEDIDPVEFLEVAKDVKASFCRMIDSLEHFAKEPWFSSLWTLQEGYLRNDAQLLDRNAQPWLTRIDRWASPGLSQFVEYINQAWASLDASFLRDTTLGQSLRLQLEKSGCTELHSTLPTVLLQASHKRIVNPTRAHDRVYGIMQVFGFRLGRSDPACPPDARFTLEELHEQLGAALLAQSPIMSQMFLHARPVPLGRGWRMGPHVVIPRLASRMAGLLSEELGRLGMVRTDARTELSVVKGADGTLVGHFSGPICPTLALMSALRPVIGHLKERDFDLEFDCVEGPDGLASTARVDDSGWQALLLGLCEQTGSETGGGRPRTIVCLLLSSTDGDAPAAEWRRRGLCFWCPDAAFVSKLDWRSREMFYGTGAQWSHQHGTFG